MTESVFDMNDAAFEKHVRMIATGFAARAYQRHYPDRSEDAAWAYAAEAWGLFVERAITCLAALEALREVELEGL